MIHLRLEVGGSELKHGRGCSVESGGRSEVEDD